MYDVIGGDADSYRLGAMNGRIRKRMSCDTCGLSPNMRVAFEAARALADNHVIA